MHNTTVNVNIEDSTKKVCKNPDSKVHVANMGPTMVLSASGEPHDGPMNLAIREAK